jgi:hypothetical protein
MNKRSRVPFLEGEPQLYPVLLWGTLGSWGRKGHPIYLKHSKNPDEPDDIANTITSL